jgi:hypothetical protein
MPTVESDLRRKLEGQGFRIEEKTKDKGWVVKAPLGADLTQLSNQTGTVHIHTAGLSTEKDKIVAILGELRKIGFDPNWEPSKNGSPKVLSLEEQTGRAVYEKPEPNPDDPDDRWVTYNEAAEIVGLKGGTGVAQRVKAGKLRAVKMPAIVPGTGGRTKQVQAWHVNVKELLESQNMFGRPGRPSTRATPVRTRFESTAAGRLSQATTQARAAMRKIERAFEELQDALKIIDDESMGALNELRDVKARQKDIEGLLERAVGKL